MKSCSPLIFKNKNLVPGKIPVIQKSKFKKNIRMISRAFLKMMKKLRNKNL
jgi:hypothetical protein